MKWKQDRDISSPRQLEIETLSVSPIANTSPNTVTQPYLSVNDELRVGVASHPTLPDSNGPTNGGFGVNSECISSPKLENGNSHLTENRLLPRIRTVSASNDDYKVNGHAIQQNGKTDSTDRYITVDNSRVTVAAVGNGRVRSFDHVDGGFPHFTTLNQLHACKSDPFRRSERRRAEWWLILVSISLGLGNVWRFPNVAYENGGGSFVLAYLIVQILLAQPLCFFELCLGQFTSGGISTSWRCFPLLKGLWVSQKLVTTYLAIYIGAATALAMNEVYDNLNDKSTFSNLPLSNDSEVIFNLSLTDEELYNSTSDEEKSQIKPAFVVCLAILWSLVFICITWSKITRSAFFVTTTFPSVCFIALLIYTILQDGAYDGIQKFFVPEWETLKNIRVWYAAIGQSLFSLSVGFGHLIIFSQFNDFKHNVLRDSILICAVDTVTSLLSGTLVFASLGTLGLSNPDVILNNIPGARLAYTSYTMALKNIDNMLIYRICLIIFFLSIYLLGISTLVPIVDCIPHKSRYEERNTKKRKVTVCFMACLVSFAIGIAYSTEYFSYLMISLGDYGIESSIVLLAVIQCVGLAWGYGISKFGDDMRFMRDRSLSIWWKFIWGFLAPIAITGVWIWHHIDDAMTKDSSRWRPTWSIILGYCLFGIAIVQVPLLMWRSYVNNDEYGCKRKIRSLVREESFWGPSDPVHRFTWLKRKDGVASVSSKNSTLNRKKKGRVNEAYDNENEQFDERL